MTNTNRGQASFSGRALQGRTRTGALNKRIIRAFFAHFDGCHNRKPSKLCAVCASEARA